MAGKENAAKQEQRVTIFEFLKSSFLVIVFSLFLSVIVEWLGMLFWWPEQGSRHSLDMVANEINYVNKDFRESNALGYSPIEFIDTIYSTFYDVDEENGSVKKVIKWLDEEDSVDDGFFKKLFKTTGNTFKEYVLAAFYISLVFTIRLSILILSLPLFILVTMVALIDGFAQRDLRRWSNGRESGLRYHYAKAMILPSFFIVWLLYLSIPMSIHPNFVVLPLAILYGYVLREAVSWFKKYL